MGRYSVFPNSYVYLEGQKFCAQLQLWIQCLVYIVHVASYQKDPYLHCDNGCVHFTMNMHDNTSNVGLGDFVTSASTYTRTLSTSELHLLFG